MEAEPETNTVQILPCPFKSFRIIQICSSLERSAAKPEWYPGAGISPSRRSRCGIPPNSDLRICISTYRKEVFDMNHCDFHYSHLLPKKPGILPLEETMTKKCRRCGAEFVTRSRIRKRCDTCQSQVSAEKQKKANERLKARRAARRMCVVAN
jgi:hypothetical protein